MNSYKLSIIIPIYNAENYIAACIDSILSQSFQDYEIILVNDGSKDSSGLICNSYANKDSRIKVIHQENKGVSEARNAGLLVSRGKFVTFIDSDDEILPNFLKNFSYDINIDFEIQGFTINYVFQKERNVVIAPKYTQITSLYDVYVEAEYQKTSRGPCCKLMKNDIIKQNHLTFPTDISFGEDAIFVKKYLICCNRKARTIAAGDYLYNQYDNPQSLTRRNHHYTLIYDYSWMDYKLFLELENHLGPMPRWLKEDFIRNRSLEFYLSMVNCICDKKLEYSSKKEYITKAKFEMFQDIKYISTLPPTYKIIRFCILNLPTGVATQILNLLFRWK